MNDDIHKARANDLPIVAATLAAAFQDDPIFTWCIPDDTRREHILPAFFTLIGQTIADHDAIHLCAGGAAMWVPPGAPVIPADKGEQFETRLEELLGADAEHTFELVATMDAHHPTVEHHYLWFLGVLPARQGTGIGTRLLDHVLEPAGRTGAPAYLEATSKENLRLYERHGFSVVDEFRAAGSPDLADVALTDTDRSAVMTGVQPCTLPDRDPGIAYDAGGDETGRPVVLLHGLSANSTSWAPVIERTSGDWRSYAIDFRGHGRSHRTPHRYRLDDYIDDADRLLQMIGQPAVVVGHSLGAIVAATLAQDCHPLVAAVFLEDPPLYVVEPGVFAESGLARGFGVLRDHIARLQAEEAPVEVYRDLLAASPHPAGDRLGDHLHEDALWSRAAGLARTDTDAISAVLDGTTFAAFEPDRPLHVAVLVVRADAAYDAAFRPDDEDRLRRTSPHVEVLPMPGSGHNIRGDRATRDRYLDALSDFLTKQPATTLEHQ